ncbi:hypothetical protein O181_021738 [Austropuccinia psidii MF-1]|uniref:Uncharacterized protein n=1 Tax=Austropuccinia psidii MF-1 TaxID=1389203 RepID=A0A9Q3CFG5_9BASI|nr:hypothetical protein [Austropuccinia psidii MF-1]
MPDFYDKIEKSWLQLAPPVGPLNESIEPSTSAKNGGDFSKTLAESSHGNRADWEPTNTTPSPRALIPYHSDGKSCTWTSEQPQGAVLSFGLLSPYMEARLSNLQQSPHQGQNAYGRSRVPLVKVPNNPESPKVYSGLKRKKGVAESKKKHELTSPLKTSHVIGSKETFQSELLWRKRNPKPEDFESRIRTYLTTLFSETTNWKINLTQEKLNQRWKHWEEIKMQINYPTEELVVGSLSRLRTFTSLHTQNPHPRLQNLQNKSHNAILMYHTTAIAGYSLLKELGLEKEEEDFLRKLHQQWFAEGALVDECAKNLSIKLKDEMILRIVDFVNSSILVKISLLNEILSPPPFKGKAELQKAQKGAFSFLKRIWGDLNVNALTEMTVTKCQLNPNKKTCLLYKLFLEDNSAAQRAIAISWHVFKSWLESGRDINSLNLELTAVLKWALNNNLMQEAIYHADVKPRVELFALKFTSG